MIYVLAVTSILLGGVGQFLLKLGAGRLVMSDSLLQTIVRIFLIPQAILGLFCFGASFVMWVFVLRGMELSIAYPMVSLSYVTVTILAAVFLGEQLTLQRLAGLALIVVGVVVLTARGA